MTKKDYVKYMINHKKYMINHIHFFDRVDSNQDLLNVLVKKFGNLASPFVNGEVDHES